MESRAKFLGHPIHQMLVAFPLGLLGASVVFDLIHRVFDIPSLQAVSYWTMAGGLLTGLLAAPFGLIDWLHIPRGSRARTVGMLHGGGNLLMLLLYAASWLGRHANEMHATTASTGLAIVGFAVSFVTAWLGGELVDRLGIGVSEGAHVNAPSSLHR